MPIFYLPLFLALVSCSLQKMALRSSTPVFEKSTETLMEEKDWEFFRSSTPGNLKFLELLYKQDPENLRLLSVVIKSFSGYAFGVHETLALQDLLNGVDESASRNAAIAYYTRALDYGLDYLSRKKIDRKLLLSNDDDALRKKLKDLKEADATALLYTAQAWGSLVNFQKENVALVSHIPKVKALFDRVCELKPDIDHNVCDMFYAQYEVSRPKMLGGNPEKGEELYQAAIQKHPHNLLIRLSYIQYAIVPMMDEEKYEKQAAVLREEFAKFSDLNRDGLENVSPYKDAPTLNLYNAIAKKRFEIIEQLRKKIF